jgi:hypothetical protein
MRARRVMRRYEREDRQERRTQSAPTATAATLGPAYMPQPAPRTNLGEMTLEDIRDEVMALVRASGYTYEQVHARGGASVPTLVKWSSKETKNPHLLSIRKTLRAIGHEVMIIPRKLHD